MQGLRNYLDVFVGMDVMLLNNIWQQAGLVNGSRGELKAVVWGEEYDDTGHPEFVVVDFKDYRGPAFKGWPEDWPKDVDRSTWVPIAPRSVCGGVWRGVAQTVHTCRAMRHARACVFLDALCAVHR